MVGNSELRHQILMYTLNSKLWELPNLCDQKEILYSSIIINFWCYYSAVTILLVNLV